MSNGSSVDILATTLRELATALRPGDPLPPSRRLVAEHAVSPVTVSAAVARLVAEGLVVTRPGRGTVVAERRSIVPADTDWQAVTLPDSPVDTSAVARLVMPAPPEAKLLSWGYLHPDLQPTAALQAAAGRAARRPHAWSAAPPRGLPELRQAMASAVNADPANVLVVPGGQAGLVTALRALVPPGEAVLVETPTYLGMLAAAGAVGLRPLPVPADRDGIRTDLLAEAFRRSGARLLYVQPTFANPTGAVLERQRRAEVLQIAAAAKAFVLEDDWARHLAIEGTPPPPLIADDAHGHVVHLASMSKPTAPSLRVAALIARGPAAARLADLRVVDDLFVARPLQEVAVELLHSPGWPRHLRALRAGLRLRRDTLLAAIAQHLPECPPPVVPQGGMHVWLRLPAGVDDVELTERARRSDLVVGAGRPYFVNQPETAFLRLTYAAADQADLTTGVEQLARLLHPRRPPAR